MRSTPVFLITLLFSLLTIGCSHKPSSRLISTQAKASLRQVFPEELFDIRGVHKVNATTPDDQHYVAQVQYTLVAKMGSSDMQAWLERRVKGADGSDGENVAEVMRLVPLNLWLMGQTGFGSGQGFEKGHAWEFVKDFGFVKTENGWMSAD